MATRIINFDHVQTPDTATINDVLGPDSNASQVLVTRRNNDTDVYEVVPKQNFNNTDMNNVTKVTPMQSDLVDGGIKTDLINQELYMYYHYFLSEFPYVKNSRAVIGDNEDWIELINFPLPAFTTVNGRRIDFRTEVDNIVIITSDYPDFPPRGVHFHKNSPNLEIFQQALNSHVFDGILGVSHKHKDEIKQLEDQGWMWMCFHYDDYRWNFNSRNIKSGDCLYKYIEMLFARLSGAQV